MLTLDTSISTFLLDQNILALPRYLHFYVSTRPSRKVMQRLRMPLIARVMLSSALQSLEILIGFDNSGSVSGYVLWINGRGVMIDPPPYSSATLEREGIRL